MLIWGDDQYENFREDCVPPFSVLAYDSVEFQPWKGYRARPQRVGRARRDKTFTVKGHRAAGKYLATALLEEGIDVAYAYKPLHHPLGHAFANSVLFLDYDRKGFPYPVVPFAVNAYGRLLIAARGAPRLPSEAAAQIPEQESDLDPPAPQPWRCFEVGAAIARALERARGAWRSSLPRAGAMRFSCRRTHLMFPDVEADKRYYEALKNGDWAAVAQHHARRGRGPRTPRAPQLVLPRRRDARAGPRQARRIGVPRIVDHQLGQGVRGLSLGQWDDRLVPISMVCLAAEAIRVATSAIRSPAPRERRVGARHESKAHAFVEGSRQKIPGNHRAIMVRNPAARRRGLAPSQSKSARRPN